MCVPVLSQTYYSMRYRIYVVVLVYIPRAPNLLVPDDVEVFTDDRCGFAVASPNLRSRLVEFGFVCDLGRGGRCSVSRRSRYSIIRLANNVRYSRHTGLFVASLVVRYRTSASSRGMQQCYTIKIQFVVVPSRPLRDEECMHTASDRRHFEKLFTSAAIKQRCR